jgi:hypothetical protein
MLGSLVYNDCSRLVNAIFVIILAFQAMEKGCPIGIVVRTSMVTKTALLTFCDHRIALIRGQSITT